MWGDKLFLADEWSTEKLLHLFNSQGGPRPRGAIQGYQVMLEQMLSRSILAVEQKIAPTRSPASLKKGHAACKDWATFKRCKHGGGDLHGWLKWWAFKWLESQSATPPELECTIPGYGRADLFSAETNTVMECGNTSPTHVTSFLKMNDQNRFILVPFQRSAIANTGALCVSPIKAYVFTNAQATGGCTSKKLSPRLDSSTDCST